MKHDFLFDAFDNISDKHIEEAVTYKANIKAFPKKRALRIAACFAVILVCAVGAKIISSNVSFKPPVTEDTYYTGETGTVTEAKATNAPSTTTEVSTSTTKAQESTHTEEPTNETTVTVTNAAPLMDPLTDIYPSMEYNGREYIGYPILIDSDRCEKIAEVEIENINDHEMTKATVYKIGEYGAEYAVAVDFEESGFIGYFLYVSNDAEEKFFDTFDIKEGCIK